MAVAADRDSDSLFELERAANSTRADLIQAVDSLHDRVSPDAIKGDLKEYARDTGHQLLESLERKARENPLQAVAIAAGVSYPLWRIVRNIPAPILLIGAGIALTRRASGGQSIPGNGEGVAAAVERGVRGVAGKVSGAPDVLKNKVAGAIEAAKTQVENAGNRATQAIGEMTTLARDKAAGAAAAASDTLADTYRSGVDVAGETTRRVGEGLTRSRDNLIEAVARHPFMIGGIGLLVGGIIASLLPVTEAENRTLGDTSDELKRRARDIGARQVEGARAVAGEVYENAVSLTKEHGLTADLARDVVRTVGEKVRTEVQRVTDNMDGRTESPVTSGY